MKPTSHLVAGLALGLYTGFVVGLDVPELVMATGVCIAGAGLPDVPILAQALRDKRAGRPMFSAEFDSPVPFEATNWFLLKEISHSPLIWAVGLIVSALLYPMLMGLLVLIFSFGVFSHWFIDIFTHVDSAFADTDQSLLWPLYGQRRPGKIPKLGQKVGRRGLGVEYRYNYKDPREAGRVGNTKDFERYFQVAGLALSAIIVLMYIAFSL